MWKNRLETMIYLYSLFYDKYTFLQEGSIKRTDGFITVTSFGDILIFDVAEVAGADDQIL